MRKEAVRKVVVQQTLWSKTTKVFLAFVLAATLVPTQQLSASPSDEQVVTSEQVASSAEVSTSSSGTGEATSEQQGTTSQDGGEAPVVEETEDSVLASLVDRLTGMTVTIRSGENEMDADFAGGLLISERSAWEEYGDYATARSNEGQTKPSEQVDFKPSVGLGFTAFITNSELNDAVNNGVYRGAYLEKADGTKFGIVAAGTERRNAQTMTTYFTEDGIISSLEEGERIVLEYDGAHTTGLFAKNDLSSFLDEVAETGNIAVPVTVENGLETVSAEVSGGLVVSDEIAKAQVPGYNGANAENVNKEGTPVLSFDADVAESLESAVSSAAYTGTYVQSEQGSEQVVAVGSLDGIVKYATTAGEIKSLNENEKLVVSYAVASDFGGVARAASPVSAPRVSGNVTFDNGKITTGDAIIYKQWKTTVETHRLGFKGGAINSATVPNKKDNGTDLVTSNFSANENFTSAYVLLDAQVSGNAAPSNAKHHYAIDWLAKGSDGNIYYRLSSTSGQNQAISMLNKLDKGKDYVVFAYDSVGKSYNLVINTENAVDVANYSKPTFAVKPTTIDADGTVEIVAIRQPGTKLYLKQNQTFTFLNANGQPVTSANFDNEIGGYLQSSDWDPTSMKVSWRVKLSNPTNPPADRDTLYLTVVQRGYGWIGATVTVNDTDQPTTWGAGRSNDIFDVSSMGVAYPQDGPRQSVTLVGRTSSSASGQRIGESSGTVGSSDGGAGQADSAWASGAQHQVTVKVQEMLRPQSGGATLTIPSIYNNGWASAERFLVLPWDPAPRDRVNWPKAMYLSYTDPYRNTTVTEQFAFPMPVWLRDKSIFADGRDMIVQSTMTKGDLAGTVVKVTRKGSALGSGLAKVSGAANPTRPTYNIEISNLKVSVKVTVDYHNISHYPATASKKATGITVDFDRSTGGDQTEFEPIYDLRIDSKVSSTNYYTANDFVGGSAGNDLALSKGKRFLLKNEASSERKLVRLRWKQAVHFGTPSITYYNNETYWPSGGAFNAKIQTDASGPYIDLPLDKFATLHVYFDRNPDTLNVKIDNAGGKLQWPGSAPEYKPITWDNRSFRFPHKPVSPVVHSGKYYYFTGWKAKGTGQSFNAGAVINDAWSVLGTDKELTIVPQYTEGDKIETPTSVAIDMRIRLNDEERPSYATATRNVPISDGADYLLNSASSFTPLATDKHEGVALSELLSGTFGYRGYVDKGTVGPEIDGKIVTEPLAGTWAAGTTLPDVVYEHNQTIRTVSGSGDSEGTRPGTDENDNDLIADFGGVTTTGTEVSSTGFSFVDTVYMTAKGLYTSREEAAAALADDAIKPIYTPAKAYSQAGWRGNWDNKVYLFDGSGIAEIKRAWGDMNLEPAWVPALSHVSYKLDTAGVNLPEGVVAYFTNAAGTGAPVKGNEYAFSYDLVGSASSLNIGQLPINYTKEGSTQPGPNSHVLDIWFANADKQVVSVDKNYISGWSVTPYVEGGAPQVPVSANTSVENLGSDVTIETVTVDGKTFTSIVLYPIWETRTLGDISLSASTTEPSTNKDVTISKGDVAQGIDLVVNVGLKHGYVADDTKINFDLIINDMIDNGGTIKPRAIKAAVKKENSSSAAASDEIKAALNGHAMGDTWNPTTSADEYQWFVKDENKASGFMTTSMDTGKAKGTHTAYLTLEVDAGPNAGGWNYVKHYTIQVNYNVTDEKTAYSIESQPFELADNKIAMVAAEPLELIKLGQVKLTDTSTGTVISDPQVVMNYININTTALFDASGKPKPAGAADAKVVFTVTKNAAPDKATAESKVTIIKGDSGETDPPVVENVTVTFQENSGSNVEDQTVPEGSQITLPASIREGYTFGGWYYDQTFTSAAGFSGVTITANSNMTLYAKWTLTKIPNRLETSHVNYVLGREGMGDERLIQPLGNITRAEAATMVFRLLSEEVREQNRTTECNLTDVSSADWFAEPVATLVKMQIIAGDDAGTFRPYDPITRAELLTIMSRVSEEFSMEATYGSVPFADIDENYWAYIPISFAVSRGWIKGDDAANTLRPDDQISRAESVAIFNRVLRRLPESTDDLIANRPTFADNNDPSVWYYVAIEEAVHNHSHEYKTDQLHERWTELKENIKW